MTVKTINTLSKMLDNAAKSIIEVYGEFSNFNAWLVKEQSAT